MIEINNLTANVIDDEFLKKVAKIILKREKSASWRTASRRKKNLDLYIAIVGPGRIKELNKKYRKKNKPTDVLSFLYNGSGDVVVCLREVKKNAKKFGFSFKAELARVLIHGILHLLGYSHEKSKQENKIMRKKEEYYLSQLKLKIKN